MPTHVLEDTSCKVLPPWFRRAEMEAEFGRSRVKLTGKLLWSGFAFSLVLSALATMHGYFYGHIDIVPPMGCFLLPPLIAIDRRWPHPRAHSRRLRQACVLTMAMYLIVRLCPWHLLIAEWPVPLAVQQGYPLPVSLLAPSMLLMVGSSIGLRIVPDLLPLAISTWLAGLAHLICVHNDRIMVGMNVMVQLVGFQTTGTALHHLERLQRCWFRKSHSRWLNDVDGVKKVRNDNNRRFTAAGEVNDNNRRFTAADEEQYAQDVLTASGNPLKLLALPVLCMPWVILERYLTASKSTGQDVTRFLLSKPTLHWLVLAMSVYAISHHEQARWTRIALIGLNAVLLNLRILTCTPAVSQALGMEPSPPLTYPLPAAIVGPVALMGAGGVIGLRLADTAPWAIATSVIGCGHSYAAMERYPVSHGALPVVSMLAALWAYWSVENGLRRSWLDKTEAECAEQRHALTRYDA